MFDTVGKLSFNMALDVVAILIFGFIAVLIAVGGTKLFDHMYSQIDFEKEIGANNLAAGVVLSSVIIGLCIVIATVIRSVVMHVFC